MVGGVREENNMADNTYNVEIKVNGEWVLVKDLTVETIAKMLAMAKEKE